MLRHPVAECVRIAPVSGRQARRAALANNESRKLIPWARRVSVAPTARVGAGLCSRPSLASRTIFFWNRDPPLGPRGIMKSISQKGATIATSRDVAGATAALDVTSARATTIVAPLQSQSGQPVRVVHLVAELSPFARSGGLGEAGDRLVRPPAGS